MVKLNIMRSNKIDDFGIDDDLETLNIVKDNFEELAQSIFIKLDDDLYDEAVLEYLTGSYDRILA